MLGLTKAGVHSLGYSLNMKNMEAIKKLVWAIMVCIVCLFIHLYGVMNDWSNYIIWLALLGSYASLIYACVVSRGMAIGMALCSGIGVAVQLIGGINDGVVIAMNMAFLIPAAVIMLRHFARNC